MSVGSGLAVVMPSLTEVVPDAGPYAVVEVDAKKPVGSIDDRL